ncbi:hypothetical protein V493_05650 [Pseudogymnoascus sp. VKM F-4281 (FW-2241)]|nr:hypothetical protein V493_05650 [Pseudogymnoascus sp. VKM F-4281 (FW-2241)]
MGQESSQVQQIEEDPSSMDDNSSTRGGVEGDYPLPALPTSRDARQEPSSSSPQRKRKMGNGISGDGAGDQSDSARRADKKLKKLLKKKSKDSIGGKDGGKDTELTSSVKQKKKKNRLSGGIARHSIGGTSSQSLQNVGRSAAAVLMPRSDTVEKVPESSHPTADAPLSSSAAKKKKKKSKAKRQSLQSAAGGDGVDAGGSPTGSKAADADRPLGKDKLPLTPKSSWAAVNVPPSATTAEKTNESDANMTNGQDKQKQAGQTTTEETESNSLEKQAGETITEETESNSLEKQADVNAVKPKSPQPRPVEDGMDLDPTQSQNSPTKRVEDEMDVVVAEPKNAVAGPADDSEDNVQEILQVINKDTPQIGVYAADEEPTSTTRRRKRRLPVDDDPVETPTKKTKRALKAKSPVTKGKKTKAAAKAPGDSSAPPRTPTRGAAAGDGKPVGKMTAEDLAVIKNQLLKYREMNDITEQEQNNLIQGKASGHQELFNMVCEEFPDRPRWSIIKFCRRKFHNFAARGKWSPEDDEELKTAYRQMPNRWTQIGGRLNRHPEDCRDRWRNYLICGDNMITESWDAEEEQRLRDAVAKCVSHLQEMKQLGLIQTNPDDDSQDDIDLVDWQRVSEEMDRTRSRLQCIQKWRRMQDREDADKSDATPLKEGVRWRESIARKEAQQMDLDDKLVILRGIKESKAGTEGRINWKEVGDEEFRRRFATRPLKVAFMTLKNTVPNSKSHKLQEIVEILLEKMENANGQDPTKESFGNTRGLRNKKSTHISEEIIRSEDEQSDDDDVEDQIMQELPKLTDTSRSSEKKKLSDRMARKSESVDSFGNAIPSGGPEVPESEYDDEPAAPKTNGALKSAKSDSDLDEEIPARRTSISL